MEPFMGVNSKYYDVRLLKPDVKQVNTRQTEVISNCDCLLAFAVYTRRYTKCEAISGETTDRSLLGDEKIQDNNEVWVGQPAVEGGLN